jgi:hypothetical protein
MPERWSFTCNSFAFYDPVYHTINGWDTSSWVLHILGLSKRLARSCASRPKKTFAFFPVTSVNQPSLLFTAQLVGQTSVHITSSPHQSRDYIPPTLPLPTSLPSLLLHSPYPSCIHPSAPRASYPSLPGSSALTMLHLYCC